MAFRFPVLALVLSLAFVPQAWATSIQAAMAAFNRLVFASLKPGGLYIVLDHSAPDGTGSSLTAATHRIDEAPVKSQVEAAGFKFEGESGLLRNPADDRKLSVFDKKIQGHTDQFLLKFRKPA
jgi:predicted methyltransferase